MTAAELRHREDTAAVAQARAEGWLGEHETAPDVGDLLRIAMANMAAADMALKGVIRLDPDDPYMVPALRRLIGKAEMVWQDVNGPNPRTA